MIPILGGLGAAALWAAATLASSRTSRVLGAQVVLAWVMLFGLMAAVPLVLVNPIEGPVETSTLVWLVLAGFCYVGGLFAAYTALRSGKVSIVAPIVATEGAIAAIISVVLGDPLSASTAILLGVIVIGVVLSAMEPERTTPITADDPVLTRRTIILSIVAALIFGVGLAATGRAAAHLPLPWVAMVARLVGSVTIALPLIASRRLRLTRATFPLLLLAGLGEVFGSVLLAWGARENIAVTAVMGSQFAAIAAVAAFLLFGERIGRIQLVGVVVIVVGVTALAAAGT